jgi:hypothetical protein
MQSFRGVDCDTDHYLVVARLRLSISKQAVLNDKEVREQYQVKISNGCAAVENMDYDVGEIDRAWERIRAHQHLVYADNILGENKYHNRKP